jgi:hypothetical protein
MSTQKVWVVIETIGEYDYLDTAVVGAAASEELAEEFAQKHRRASFIKDVGEAYQNWNRFRQSVRDNVVSSKRAAEVYAIRGLDWNNFFTFHAEVFRPEESEIVVQELDLITTGGH